MTATDVAIIITAVVALVTAVGVVITAIGTVIIGILQVVNHKAVGEVKHLVNSRAEEQDQWIVKLLAALEASGVKVPNRIDNNTP